MPDFKRGFAEFRELVDGEQPDKWPDRAWLISHWVGHRCGYVDCRVTEIHEHGGGEPMREMTPAEQMAALFDGSDRPGEP